MHFFQEKFLALLRKQLFRVFSRTATGRGFEGWIKCKHSYRNLLWSSSYERKPHSKKKKKLRYVKEKDKCDRLNVSQYLKKTPSLMMCPKFTWKVLVGGFAECHLNTSAGCSGPGWLSFPFS